MPAQQLVADVHNDATLAHEAEINVQVDTNTVKTPWREMCQMSLE